VKPGSPRAEGGTFPDSQRGILSLPRPTSCVVITGYCRGTEFVPMEVLIHADSLGSEEAIRSWLESRGIKVRC
jgi:hypothetical protein